MRKLNNVVKFAETTPELYAAFEDYFNHAQSLRGFAGKVFANTTLEEKDRVITELFAAEVAKRSGESLDKYDGNVVKYAKNPQVKFFADDIRDNMIDAILPETIINSIGLIADIRFGGYDDSFRFDVKNNALLAVSKAGRRQRTAPAQRLFDTTVTLVPEVRELTVTCSLPEILTGRTSIAQLALKAARSIETQMLFDAYDAFTTAMEVQGFPSGLTVSGYSENSLIGLCEKVTAYNGSKAVIMGTPVALKSVLPAATTTRILLDSEYVKAGHLPVFNGYDVIPMEQVADYTTTNYGLKLKDNRLYVVSPAADKLVKIAVAGDTMSYANDTFDHANLAQQETLTKAWATGVITNAVAGIITLS